MHRDDQESRLRERLLDIKRCDDLRGLIMGSRRPRTGIFKQVHKFLPGAESGEAFDEGISAAPVKQDWKWSKTSER
ncbi:MAG: hypothetical protein CMP47_06340 [Rickettsiales bacterium]|nr:hypothetical protein [Rickettsiales bacterium]